MFSRSSKLVSRSVCTRFDSVLDASSSLVDPSQVYDVCYDDDGTSELRVSHDRVDVGRSITDPHVQRRIFRLVARGVSASPDSS